MSINIYGVIIFDNSINDNIAVRNIYYVLRGFIVIMDTPIILFTAKCIARTIKKLDDTSEREEFSALSINHIFAGLDGRAMRR